MYLLIATPTFIFPPVPWARTLACTRIHSRVNYVQFFQRSIAQRHMCRKQAKLDDANKASRESDRMRCTLAVRILIKLDNPRDGL